LNLVGPSADDYTINYVDAASRSAAAR